MHKTQSSPAEINSRVPPSGFMNNSLLVWSQFRKSFCINRSQWHAKLCS